MFTAKGNAQLTNTQSVMLRYAGQHDYRDAVTFGDQQRSARAREQPHQDVERRRPAQLGARQQGAEPDHRPGQSSSRVSDVTSNITGQHYTRDFPSVPIFPPRLSFPTVNTGAGGSGGSLTDTYVLQLKRRRLAADGQPRAQVRRQFERAAAHRHYNNNEHFATLTFFDDPSVILSNSNGRYPQGFQTPGIVRQWQQANGGAMNGAGSAAESRKNAQQAMAWFQDDWRVNVALTLNLGVR